jgi:hypothetical protein
MLQSTHHADALAGSRMVPIMDYNIEELFLGSISRARLTWGSQVKRIRSSFLRVSDPKSEPFMIRAGLPVHRIKLTYGRRSITVVPTSRLRRA